MKTQTKQRLHGIARKTLALSLLAMLLLSLALPCFAQETGIGAGLNTPSGTILGTNGDPVQNASEPTTPTPVPPTAPPTPTPPPTPAPSSSTKPPVQSGSIYIVGYTVFGQNGDELQKVSVGEKCRIVVSLRDTRFTTEPNPTTEPGRFDKAGNIVNIKITSTATFATPSFGDIKQTTAKAVNGELSYAAVFNDITYLGGENTLAFDIAYVDGSVGMQNVSIGISECYDTAKGTSAKPTVMVRDSSYGTANVNAGDAFTLVLTSYNTSKTIGITDVMTTISLPAQLTLAGGSNTVLTSAVAAGASFANTFQLQAQNNAETGVVNITVNYTYYMKGAEAQLTSSQLITVSIVQPDRFSFTTMDVPTELYAGEEGTLTLGFVNKGKGILYNLSAEISGNLENPSQMQYVGNLASGTEGSVDFDILAKTAGTVSGVITLTYEDINGVEKKQTKEYSAVVGEAPATDPGMDGMGPMMPEEPEAKKGLPWWGWALIAGGGLTAIVVIVKIIKKKKAKKIERELAEDNDDEDF
ncbi:MAG: hypothetical protein RSF73_07035 [Ruthenibacterium sp.]